MEGFLLSLVFPEFVEIKTFAVILSTLTLVDYIVYQYKLI